MYLLTGLFYLIRRHFEVAVLITMFVCCEFLCILPAPAVTLHSSVRLEQLRISFLLFAAEKSNDLPLYDQITFSYLAEEILK